MADSGCRHRQFAWILCIENRKTMRILIRIILWSRIRILIKVSWIWIPITFKIHELLSPKWNHGGPLTLTIETRRLKMKAWRRLKMKAWRLKMDPWRDCRPPVADLHHLEKEQDPLGKGTGSTSALKWKSDPGRITVKNGSGSALKWCESATQKNTFLVIMNKKNTHIRRTGTAVVEWLFRAETGGFAAKK